MGVEGEGAVTLAGVGEPGGAVDDEVLVGAAKSNEEVAVVGELAEAVIRAVDVVDSVAGAQVLVEMPEEVDGSARAGGENLALEDPGCDVVAPQHQSINRSGWMDEWMDEWMDGSRNRN